MHHKKCVVCGVKYGCSKKKRMFLAKFPLEETRCKQWVKATGIEDLVYVPIEKLHSLKYVCGNHFTSKDFNKKKNRLKNSAIPTKDMNANPLPDAMLEHFPLHTFTCNNDNIYLQAQQTQQLTVEVPSQAEVNISNEPSTSTQGLCVMSSKDSVSRKRKRAPSPEAVTKPHEKSTTRSASKIQINRTNSPEPSTSTQGLCVMSSKDSVSRKRKRAPSPDLEITPRKKKLLKKLDKCQNRLKCLQKESLKRKIRSPALKSLIKAHLRNQKRKPQGKRWTPEDKSLALSIYKKSPKCFRYLKHVMSFPSIRTLQMLVQKMVMEPGISECIINNIKKKAAKANEKERICALLFDEMALKKRLVYNVRTDKVEGFVDLGDDGTRSHEVADHALVFMLQGLYKKIKQPVAYYFVKGTTSSQNLAVLIKKVINTITETGFEVISTVCDQGPTNIGSLNLLKRWSDVPIDSNYFLVDNKKVFIMYDVPHLFKSIRNNFLQGGEIMIDSLKGKWSHLVELEEKNHTTLHFKKITPLHVKPKFKSKMKVKLAAQILSNTVAAILKLLAEKYEDTEKGREISQTAKVIELLDGLFDCTNGPSSRRDIKKNIRENVSKKTNHSRLWHEYKNKILGMHFLKSDSQLRLRNVRCVQGFYTSLCSLQDIWKYVESKGFRYLNLRQLNQDALENLFGMIRQHSPTNRNPTCHHFTCALKSNILTQLSAPISRGGNCEEDENVVMLDLDDLFSNPAQTETAPKLVTNSTVEPQTPTQTPSVSDDFTLLSVPEEMDKEDLEIETRLFEQFEKQPTVYVSGYVAKVVSKNTQCHKCIQSLKIDNPEECASTMYSYINLREWWTDKTSLTYPSLRLCQLVDTATKTFEEEIRHCIHKNNISLYTVTMMLTKCHNIEWLCEEHKNIILDKILVRLSHLLIRNECHRINETFAIVEESSADVIKRAELQGIAK